MINALTIDVEDYFHVAAFERHVKYSDWDLYPLRVKENTMRILDLLDVYSVKATFFVLGWVAEKAPNLIKSIKEKGHEIACHSYRHQLVYNLDSKMFKEDIRRAKAILEDITGEQVLGYRAPTYSITNSSIWALDVLIEEGFKYDSSIFPITHDLYGISDAKRFPHVINREKGSIIEFPMSTLNLHVSKFKIRFPIAGGGYLRAFPSFVIERGIKWINQGEKEPAVIYFHPWEIDPEQPRINAELKSRFRHYLNLNKTIGRIERLLKTIRFAPMKDVLKI
jgi:polysaccharide deacetylase family protein (PEP-CTERM system associated)